LFCGKVNNKQTNTRINSDLPEPDFANPISALGNCGALNKLLVWVCHILCKLLFLVEKQQQQQINKLIHH